MKRRRFFLYIILLLLVAFSVSLLWSIYTVRGTSFLLKGMAKVLPGTVEMKKVTGRIGHSLHVEGLKLNLADLTVTVDTADMKWQPLYLLTGKLAITSLDIRGTSITNNKPSEDKPIDLSFPTAPGWLTILQGWINDLNIVNLKYAAPGRKLVVIESFYTKIIWYRSILYINEVNARTGYGTAKGAVMVDLARPALRALLKVKLKKAVPGSIDNVSMDARLPASKGEEQIAGPVTIKAWAGQQERFNLKCRLALARHAVRISQARLAKKEGKGTIEVKGMLDVSGNKPAFTLSAGITGLDLAPEAPLDTSLSGNIDIAGTLDDFKGRFNLVNPGASWRQIELKGDIRGSNEHIELKDLEAKLLGGAISGHVNISRAKDMTLSARFTGKGLNPVRMRPGLEGNLNFTLKGQVRIPENDPIEGHFKASLMESRFQNRAVTADLDASFGGKTIKINTLAARGNGFSVKANGIVRQRLSYEVRIDDASKLLPGAAGRFFASGWARWRDNEPAGSVSAQGKGLAYGGTRAASFSAAIQMPEGYKGEFSADVRARNVSHGIFLVNTINTKVKGKVRDHGISLAALYGKDSVDLQAKGKYADGAWQGTILKISGREALFGSWGLAGPSNVHVSKKRVALSSFALRSAAGESIDISADVTMGPMVGSVGLTWQRVNLARASRLTSPLKLEGNTSGASRVQWLKGKRLAFSGEIKASGTLFRESMRLKVAGIDGRLHWDGSGLAASCHVYLGDNGRIDAAASSKRPAAFSLPGQGTFRATWKALDMGMLQPVFPDTTRVKGRLSGEIKGDLLPGSRFNLTGRTDISDGSFSWLIDNGEVTAPIKEAAIQWKWKDASLDGNVNLVLAQYGHAEASFKAPLAARLPLKMDSDRPMTVSAKGAMREKGLLAALLPGLAQETSGDVNFNLTAGGTFADPRLNGRLSLNGAGAYLPPAGIHLKNVSAEVLFDNDRIAITSFLVHSGPGYIGVKGTIQHKMRRIRAFDGTIRGERFRAIDLPELQASISPELSFTGDAKKVSVRGSVLIPEALIREEQRETLIKPSTDVIIAGRDGKPGKALPFTLDIAMTVALGDRVMVKAYGIDTRLAGKVNITMKDSRNIMASGTISTVKGRFDAYGVKLDVRRGQITFGGGPVDQANLNILALRKVSDVSAGVLVTGTPSSPLINLYSDPSMPDMDILSYIVLGRPRGASGQADTALLARAAGALLTSGRSSAIQKQLGLDVIDVESTGGDASRSIIRVGKYLSPKLYVSYGRSVYTGENLFGIRYSLSRRVDVESTMGNESSAVIYYKINFE